MPTRTRPAYAPLPASLPAVLAPSSPLPPSFDAAALALSSALADSDKPRRGSGLAHSAPPALGLPQLVSTAVRGRWGAPSGEAEAPPWVLARTAKTKDERRRDRDEQRAWERLGVAGLPRNEAQAEQWENVKRDWRAERDRPLVHDGVTVKGAPKERRTSAGRAATATLAGHFASSKPAVAAASSSKKRPPSSPPHAYVPSPSSVPVPIAAKPTKREKRPSASASFPSLSPINSAGQEVISSGSRGRLSQEQARKEDDERDELASDADDGEVLFERGCTQLSTLSAAAKPTLHRLSSIARTTSALSVHSSGGAAGEEDADAWDQFLDADARD
ncbi:hypothetical protein JCM10449v2_001600 [Rhodotorula kratochvilovae]